jgi:hypothetical protein
MIIVEAAESEHMSSSGGMCLGLETGRSLGLGKLEMMKLGRGQSQLCI